MDPSALELSPVSITAVAVFFGLLLLAVILLLLAKLRQKRVDADTVLWLGLYHYALRRGVLGAQTRPLKVFFQALSRDEQEQIPGNRVFFRKLFLPFIEKYPHITQAQKVELIEKVTPETDVAIEIRTPSDLHLGEACALEFGGEHYLGFVTKLKENQALFSLRNWDPQKPLTNEPIVVYSYRHGYGGYIMKGTIIKAAKNGMAVAFTGEISFRGNEHLMALLQWDLHFTQWPAPEVFGSEGDEIEEISPEKETLDFHATSEKVSDRAMLIKLNETVPLHVLQSQELWQLETRLPDYDGSRLEVRVRLLPSPSTRGRYIAKFVDIDDVSRNALWEVIKQNNPVREYIN